MSMYVIRVKPGMDCEVAASLRKRGYFIRCPQRTLSIRKDGTWTDRTEPIFVFRISRIFAVGVLL